MFKIVIFIYCVTPFTSSTANLVRVNEYNHVYRVTSSVANTSQYTSVLDSLNTLSATAWKVNRPILDLQVAQGAV